MKSLVVAKALIVNDAREVLALRRSQTDTRRPGQWDFPGGQAEKDESGVAAATRETYEETGLEVEMQDLPLYTEEELEEESIPGYSSAKWEFYLAHVAGTPEVRLSFEHDAFAWKDPEVLLGEMQYDRQIRMLRYVLRNGLLVQAYL